MGIAEREAKSVLKQCGVNAAPIDVIAIAERLGAEGQKVPHDGSISGMLYREPRRIVIGVNERDALTGNDSPSRTNLDI